MLGAWTFSFAFPPTSMQSPARLGKGEIPQPGFRPRKQMKIRGTSMKSHQAPVKLRVLVGGWGEQGHYPENRSTWLTMRVKPGLHPR